MFGAVRVSESGDFFESFLLVIRWPVGCLPGTMRAKARGASISHFPCVVQRNSVKMTEKCALRKEFKLNSGQFFANSQTSAPNAIAPHPARVKFKNDLAEMI